MIQKAKKRSLFLIGLLVTSIVSVLHVARSVYSDEESLLVSVAHADVSVYSGGAAGAGDGCGGCSGSDSGDGGGSGDGAGDGTGGGGVGDGGACFPAGTLVSTPDGKKEIQTIQKGDVVYGFDPATGETVASVVTETMKHASEEATASPLIVVTHEGGEITLTTNHPVYKKGGVSKEGFQDFENAGMLKVGDILTTESGEEATITAIAEGPAYDYVYNIEVDKVHTYNADNIRVHNKF